MKNGAYIHHEDDTKYYTRINAIKEGASRQEIVGEFYRRYEEDSRLERRICGRLEYATTMHYIHKYLKEGDRILEIGAGTGRYSIALAKEGYDVTALELVDRNLAILKENSKDLDNIKACQGDATNLEAFADNSFDITLVFGPLYHLYEQEEIDRAIEEAIRVTRKDGVILFAFISVYAIMYANYFYGNWGLGEEENFTKDYKVKHFKEQLFTGYDVAEFENLFKEKEITYITTTGVDGLIEPIEKRSDFSVSDEDFVKLSKWYLSVCEKRELLGNTNHLLYICKKK